MSTPDHREITMVLNVAGVREGMAARLNKKADSEPSISPERYGERVRFALMRGLKEIVKAGGVLEQAVDDFKQRDGHWKHLYSRMLKAANLSQQQAHTLRTIAAHPFLSNPDNVRSLPVSVSTLGELATLSETKVRGLLESGVLTPKIKRGEVRRLKQGNHTPAGGSTKKEKQPTGKESAGYDDWITKQEKAEFERRVDEKVRQELETMQHEFNSAVDKKVDEKVRVQRQNLHSLEAEAKMEFDQTIKMKAGVKAFMNKDEFMLVRSCLHPDKNPHPRAGEAFTIFNRLADVKSWDK